MTKRIAHYKTIPIETLTKIVAGSYSYSEVLRKIGYRVTGSTNSMIKKFISIHRISTSHFSVRGRSGVFKTVKINISHRLCEDSTCDRGTIKKYLIKNNIIDYHCSICKIGPEWNKNKLVLILDHINGINNDNRLKNLRFLCPNCNSQTDTFCTRNIKKTNLGKLNIESKISSKVNKKKLINALIKNKNASEAASSLGIVTSLFKKECLSRKIDMDYWIQRLNKLNQIREDFYSGVPIKKISKNYNTTMNNIKFLLSNGLRGEPYKKYLISLLLSHKTMEGAAKEINLSGTGLKKKLVRLGIDYEPLLKKYDKDQVISYYVKSSSMTKTAKEFNLSIRLIKKVLNENNIKIFIKKPIDLNVKIRAAQLLKSGLSCLKTAEELGISIYHIKRYKKMLRVDEKWYRR